MGGLYITKVAGWIYWYNIYFAWQSIIVLPNNVFLYFLYSIAIEIVKFITAPLHVCTVLNLKRFCISMFQSPFPFSFDESTWHSFWSLPPSVGVSICFPTVSLGHPFSFFSSIILIFESFFSTQLCLFAFIFGLRHPWRRLQAALGRLSSWFHDQSLDSCSAYSALKTGGLPLVSGYCCYCRRNLQHWIWFQALLWVYFYRRSTHWWVLRSIEIHCSLTLCCD